VQIKDKEFELYIKSDEIQKAITKVAQQIENDYQNKDVIFVGVLNGAFMFVSDLLKNIKFDCEISFIKVASYQGTTSTGKVHELIGLVNDIKNKHVIILEDIVDTGLTLNKIYSLIDHDDPSSLEVATLLYKPSAFNGKHPPKYVGIEIPNQFIVGYGLDYLELGRNTEDIYKLKA
jgi:hypoxanthine phosphoribosyltransferase